MYPPGHVGLTAMLFAPLLLWFRVRDREQAATECLVSAVVLSLLPDIDSLLPGLVHRGVTHTIIAALAVGLLLPAVFRLRADVSTRLRPESVLLTGLVGIGSIASHLVGDVITPMGIRPLFPVWGTTYSLDLVRASSPMANAALLLAGGLAVTLCYTVPARPSASEADERPLHH